MTSVVNSTKSLSGMRDTLYFMISESPNSTIFNKNNMNTAINAGLSTVSDNINRYSRKIERFTEVGVEEYQIPDPYLLHGRALVDTAYIDNEEISGVAYVSADKESGKPSAYYIINNRLGFDTVPDDAYEIRIVYRSELAPLANDSDETPLPDLGIHAAMLYAAYLLKLKDEEFGSSDRFYSAFEDALKRISSIQTGVYKAKEVNYGGAI